jgi:hypothetical protein
MSEAMRLPEDGLSGHGFVELRLTDLLDANHAAERATHRTCDGERRPGVDERIPNRNTVRAGLRGVLQLVRASIQRQRE